MHWDYGKLLAEDLQQYDAAAAEYRVVLNLLPHSYTGHNSLASVLRGKGDMRAAIAEYETTLAMKPTAGETHYYLGWCLMKEGQEDAGMNHYRKAIRYAPDCVPAYLGLGEWLFKKGELKKALDVCQAGLAVAQRVRCSIPMPACC